VAGAVALLMALLLLLTFAGRSKRGCGKSGEGPVYKTQIDLATHTHSGNGLALGFELDKGKPRGLPGEIA
jgi:hypothetical protein